MFRFMKKAEMPSPDRALPGRATAIPTAKTHAIFRTPLKGPFPAGVDRLYVGMGCFWGAERKFWELGDGIVMTSVGYQAGYTPNPTYEEVCSGQTGHNEVVEIVYDPAKISVERLLKCFFESHDPTQGNRQGNDVGTQYRSGIYATSATQKQAVIKARDGFQRVLDANGFGAITTEILDAPEYFYAEDYHQQYLHKNPGGYCGLGGTGLECPSGIVAAE